MKNFNKTVHIGTYDKNAVFCKIEIKDGKLSISGVEGPMANGDCRGSCGQIDMHLREDQANIKPAPGWNAEMLARFFNVWQKWHLNDMRPNCAHQVGPDWTSKDVTIYHYNLTREALSAKNAAEKCAVDAPVKGETFTPTPTQTKLAALPYSISTYVGEIPEHYERTKQTTYSRPTETKRTGWLHANEHPEGFLAKRCPVCGYKYGTKWLREELPQDVIAFLQSLPDTDMRPAWV